MYVNIHLVNGISVLAQMQQTNTYIFQGGYTIVAWCRNYKTAIMTAYPTVCFDTARFGKYYIWKDPLTLVPFFNR